MASGSRKVIYAALVGNLLISITKFFAASITSSSAMLSEGIHSLVDTGNQVLLLYGLKRAARPADKQFPFGHGKELYFWSFIVAILIFAVGAGVSIYEGVQHLLHPEPISSFAISYVVLALAMVFEGTAWYFAWREFSRHKRGRGTLRAVQEGKDPTLFVVLFEDSAAMLGLVVAFVGVLLTEMTGILWFDGLASVLIGCILAGTAIWLAHETKGLLIGEAARPEVIATVRRMASEHPHIHHVNEVLTLHMGPDFILVNVGVEFDDEATADDIENIIAELDRGLKAELPRVKRVFIEAEKARRPAHE